MAVSKAHESFGEDGKLKDPKQMTTLAAIAQRLVTVVARLGAGA
jgi:hypothetical protein